MQPALAQVCSLNAPFEKDVEDYAAGQCRAIEVWFGKLESYLERHTLDDVRQLIERHNVTLPVASFQGGLFMPDEERRSAAWRTFTQRLGICKELGIGTVVIAGDLAGQIDQAALALLKVRLEEAAQLAAGHTVRLAFEFQGRAACVNNLETAAHLIHEIGSPRLGICFDLFHYYTGPSKPEDLALLSPDNLFHVQLCDLIGVYREFATDADRVLPHDGDLQELSQIVEHLQRIGYAGHVSVELMNPLIWQIPPRQFGEIALTSLRQLLGQASMG